MRLWDEGWRRSGRYVAGMALLIKVALLASITVLIFGSSPIAHAQSAEPLELKWETPAACMSASVARAAIRGLIRAERYTERARVRVLIEGTQQRGYVARIEIARGESTGERELRGARCDELAEAAVLVVAMAIDPEGAAARAAAVNATPSASRATGETTPSETVQAEPENEGAPVEVDDERIQDEPRREPAEDEDEPVEDEDEDEDEPSDPRATGRFVLGVRGTGDAGSLPSATLGGGLIAGIHWPRLRLELQALAYLPQLQEHGPAPGSATEITLSTGAITGCYDLLGARDEERALGACAAIEAGVSRGRPQLISDGREASGFWLAGFAGIDARQRVVGPLHLRLLAEAGLPVVRPLYEIAPFGRIFRASPLLGRFGISLFVLFP
jgi:hypothetical protein